MCKLLYLTPLLLAACASPTFKLCDREAQAWDKFNTQEDQYDV